MSANAGLAATVEKIIDAAIEAEMAWNGFEGSVTSGFQNDGGYITITPPSGPDRSSGGDATGIEGQSLSPSELTDANRELGWNVLGDVYQKWQRDIRFVFEPWMDLPDPGAFGPVIGRLEEAATALTEEGSWQPPVAETGGVASVLSANPELRVFNNLFSRLDDMGGSAIFTFNSNYASRLPGLMSAHGALAQMLLFVARAERAIWEATAKDITDIAEKVLTAMEASKNRQAGEATSVLTVLGAVASAATLVPGPHQGAAGAASTVIGLIQTVSGDAEAEAPEPEIPFGDPMPWGVYDKLVAGVQRLDDTITAQEQALQTALQQALGQAQSDAQAAGYNLRPPSGLLHTTDPDKIVSDELNVSHQNLTWIADSALPSVAGAMTRAAHKVGSSQDSGPWYRHVSIGIGASGPLLDFQALAERLCFLLSDTATELHQVAQRVRYFAEDVRRTDAAIHDLLVAQTKQIDHAG